MTTVIARTATSFLFSLLVLFALFLLLRGHHEPGGGFVGGLVAGGAIALYAFTHSIEDARRLFAADPRHVITAGLGVALASGLLGVLAGRPPFTGQWTTAAYPVAGAIDVGTPLVFDVGVFLVVTGVTVAIVLALGEE